MTRQDGIALWRQIANALRQEIASGDRPPGTQLPTEAELSARFDVNRHTVRRAIEELSRGGLVRVEQGRGSFVAEDVIDYTPKENVAERLAKRFGASIGAGAVQMLHDSFSLR